MTLNERQAVVDEDHTRLTYYGDTLAPHLTCHLCGGLLRDAMTVKECLHRFCKSCVVKWYRNADDQQMRKCPHCSVTLEDYGYAYCRGRVGDPCDHTTFLFSVSPDLSRQFPLPRPFNYA